MQTNIHLRYLQQLFLECEMFQQSVDKTKEHLLHTVLLSNIWSFIG